MRTSASIAISGDGDSCCVESGPLSNHDAEERGAQSETVTIVWQFVLPATLGFDVVEQRIVALLQL